MIRARVYFTCKHLDDQKVQVDVGPHVIEDKGGCDNCAVIVQNFLDDLQLASHPDFYINLKKMTTKLILSLVVNVISFLALCVLVYFIYT